MTFTHTPEPEVFYTLADGISELLFWDHDDVAEAFTVTLFDDGSGELDITVGDDLIETLAISSFTRTPSAWFITAEGREFVLGVNEEAAA